MSSSWQPQGSFETGILFKLIRLCLTLCIKIVTASLSSYRLLKDRTQKQKIYSADLKIYKRCSAADRFRSFFTLQISQDVFCSCHRIFLCSCPSCQCPSWWRFTDLIPRSKLRHYYKHLSLLLREHSNARRPCSDNTTGLSRRPAQWPCPPTSDLFCL